ncbi:hypothetical protein LTR78_003771 [Recurvomyces mirabilis]|uniref:F-box domain-containing protein n=1 Tax=Recurvomyces mirabilis TaxID=574656 RepID=A0AAE0WRJ8_9PEZI|nr:hypothetical protein LTR78_003771 [Recurvomyces mirabilis]KAK5154883.1 hypothetical protein LTS14_006464 [Recurvomyces mirabilis]
MACQTDLPSIGLASLSTLERRHLSHQVNTISAVRRRNMERLSILEQRSTHSDLGLIIQGLREDNDAYAKLVTQLADLIPSVYGQTTRAATLAKQVFGTFELLELILLFLKPRRLLVAMCASKIFRDTALASPPTLRRMGLLPESGLPCIPIVQYWPFAIDIKPVRQYVRDRAPEAWTVQFSITTLSADSAKHLHFGSRSRKVLICQPPPKSMDVWTNCCRPENADPILTGQWPPHPLETLRSEGGITVGQIVDAAIRVMGKHRSCSLAPRELYDEREAVRCAINFKATVQM